MKGKALLKYETILLELRQRIANGEFSEQGKLPTEGELATQYNCSRPTIRKALDELEDSGFLITRKGSGTYLSQEIIESPLSVEINGGKGSRNLLLGLLFQDFGPSYIFDTICNQLTKIAAETGYSMVYGGYVSSDSADFSTQVNLFVQRLINLKVDGVFFAPFEYCVDRDALNHQVLQQFEKAHIAVVLIDTDVDDFPKRSNIDLVSLDHIQSGYIITNHLILQGAKRIIFIAPPNSAHTIKLRTIGFNASLIDNDIIPLKRNYVELNPDNHLEVKKCIDELMPEAIVCSNDTCASNLVDSLLKIGYKVPDDILVAGFDNSSAISKLRVPLTSIMQPLAGIAREAVRTMFRRIENPHSDYTTIRLQGTLVIRKSSAR